MGTFNSKTWQPWVPVSFSKLWRATWHHTSALYQTGQSHYTTRLSNCIMLHRPPVNTTFWKAAFSFSAPCTRSILQHTFKLQTVTPIGQLKTCMVVYRLSFMLLSFISVLSCSFACTFLYTSCLFVLWLCPFFLFVVTFLDLFCFSFVRST